MLMVRETLMDAFKFDFNMIIEEGYFYEELSPVLQQKVVNQLFSSFIDKFSLFFAEMDQGFVRELTVNLHARFFSEGDVVFNPGQKVCFLVFVATG